MMDILRSGLKQISSSKNVHGNEKDENTYFEQFYGEWKSDKIQSHASFSSIPRFYSTSSAKPDSPLKGKLLEAARSEFLQRQGEQILNNDELKELCLGLDKLVCRIKGQEIQSLQYDELRSIVDSSSKKLKDYFKPSVVVKLQKNAKSNKIPVVDILNYAMRKTWLMQSKIGLHLYDSAGNGFLSENDMENYIAELIPTLPQLERLEKTFHPFYICGAVRKFMFFLDPLRTGKIKVQDVLMSTFLDDVLDLRDEDLPEEFQESNWFSAPTALRVYGHYLYLDSDHNGMLSKEEFRRFGSGTLTGVFIDRIFQECLTYDDEVDYKTYLNLVLALENRGEPQSLQFLFRLLDINGRGYLDGFTLNYFFKAIQDQIFEAGQEPVLFEDIKDEIFDMIKPADPCKITVQDLIRSGQGDLMINILIELNGFYSYENREVRPPPESDSSNQK